MNYSETLAYMYSQLPMFSRMGSAAYKKDLTNTLILCESLNNPHTKFPSIHIAGTNGKGSVSHMLAAILRQAGYKTGLYTSPHLHDFRERIKINGEFIEEQFVVDFVQKVRPLIEEIQPSFFEITVAMAFDYFAREKVDVAVVEVGLGGRLDSTNIITPEVSVITNIGYDHVNILGNSLQEIAAEKAGIIKEKVPVVIGEKNKETIPVFTRIASEKQAPVFFAEDHFIVERFQLSTTNLNVMVLNVQNNIRQVYQLDLPGIYQTRNIVTVLEAVEILKQRSWSISEEDILTACKNVKDRTGLHGRWEVVHEHPAVVLEVAHNEDGIRQMVQHLQQISFGRLHIVFGMVKDKDIDPVIRLLPRQALYYFTQAQIPRALDVHILQSQAAALGLQGEAFENVNLALKAAIHNASESDLILVCGSIFLVAEVNKEDISRE